MTEGPLLKGADHHRSLKNAGHFRGRSRPRCEDCLMKNFGKTKEDDTERDRGLLTGKSGENNIS